MGTDPAVVLTPSFLRLVRETWGTADDLALLAATGMSVQFCEAKNTALIDRIWPAWQHAVSRLASLLAVAIVGVLSSGQFATALGRTAAVASGLAVLGAASSAIFLRSDSARR